MDAKRRAFLRKWRLRCHPVATSLEEAGDQLFTFLRFPSDQSKSIRTTNAIEQLRGVQATHQDPMHAALRRHRLHAVLGIIGQRADHPTQS